MFKNEDAMYSMDHQILQMRSVLNHLRKEQRSADEWEKTDQAHRYQIKHLSRVSLEIIHSLYETFTNKKMNAADKIRSQPKIVLQVFIDRFQQTLEQAQAERETRVQEWKQCCEQNFTKSLDHRSFFFKEAQKKQLQGKKQIDELKRT